LPSLSPLSLCLSSHSLHNLIPPPSFPLPLCQLFYSYLTYYYKHTKGGDEDVDEDEEYTDDSFDYLDVELEVDEYLSETVNVTLRDDDGLYVRKVCIKVLSPKANL
jgi:hypothetical protein